MAPKFTTPCFIRKNTYELRKKLEKLGYELSSCVNGRHTGTIYCYGGYCFASFPLDCPKDAMFDCGENENLFLALAALRADSDKYQWFKCTSPILEGCIRYIRGDLRQCFTNIMPNKSHWRKVTAYELIEHFNKDKRYD